MRYARSTCALIGALSAIITLQSAWGRQAQSPPPPAAIIIQTEPSTPLGEQPANPAPPEPLIPPGAPSKDGALSDTSSMLEVGQVKAKADELEAQAVLGEQTAAKLRLAPLADVVSILRQAEAGGLANAWLPRRRITEAPPEAGDVLATEPQRDEAIYMLTGQARRQQDLARALVRIANESRNAPANLVDKIIGLKPSTAVGVMISAPVDPASGKVGGEVSAPITLFTIGQGGAATADFPGVAAVVLGDDAKEWVGCTGTLISPRVVLTAGHCQDTGKLISVFFQGVGSRDVVDVVRPKSFAYDGGEPIDDIALAVLGDPVTEIRPAVLSTTVVAPATLGRIVGFGARSELKADGTVASNEIVWHGGMKLQGQVETIKCTATAKSGRLCWDFKGGSGAATCQGDSGGPLFVTRDGVTVLAGVTSYGFGGSRYDPCPLHVRPVDTEVAPHTAWIQEQLKVLDPSPTTLAGKALFAADNPEDRYAIRRNYLRVSSPKKPLPYRFAVMAGATAIRITINGTDEGGTAGRLIVRDSSGAQVCDVSLVPILLTCAVPMTAAAGDWSAEVSGHAGQEMQFAAVAF